MRRKRITYPGAQYHVTARTNRQEMIFKNETYKTLLLEYIVRAKKKYTFEVYSLCIMGNHFHMIIKPIGNSELATIMKSILGGFAVKFNRINGYKGHVWYDRFKSRVVETIEYFERVVAYIANNPVRAAIVQHPLQYKFSSITMLKRDNLGKKYTRIRKLFLSIIEKPSEEMDKFTANYLNTFDFMKSMRKSASLSLQDKSPGRPRKS